MISLWLCPPPQWFARNAVLLGSIFILNCVVEVDFEGKRVLAHIERAQLLPEPSHQALFILLCIISISKLHCFKGCHHRLSGWPRPAVVTCEYARNTMCGEGQTDKKWYKDARLASDCLPHFL